MLINTHGDVNLVTTAVYHSGGPRTHRGHPKCLQMCRAEMEGNKTKSKKTKGERENIEDEEETQKVSHKKERGRRKRRLKRLATCKSALKGEKMCLSQPKEGGGNVYYIEEGGFVDQECYIYCIDRCIYMCVYIYISIWPFGALYTSYVAPGCVVCVGWPRKMDTATCAAGLSVLHNSGWSSS